MSSDHLIFLSDYLNGFLPSKAIFYLEKLPIILGLHPDGTLNCVSKMQTHLGEVML